MPPAPADSYASPLRELSRTPEWRRDNTIRKSELALSPGRASRRGTGTSAYPRAANRERMPEDPGDPWIFGLAQALAEKVDGHARALRWRATIDNS